MSIAPSIPFPASPSTRALRVIAEAMRGSLKPTEQLSVAAYADKYRIVAMGTSPFAEDTHRRWVTSRVPYQLGPMLALDKPGVRKVTLMWAKQLGKTEIFLNWAFRNAYCRPSPMMAVYPSKELAAKFNEERLVPSLKASEHLRSRQRSVMDADASARGDIKALVVRFGGGMTLSLAGSNSQAALEMTAIKNLYIDELDAGEFHKRGLGLAELRQQAYADARRLCTSAPSDENVGIHAEYLDGNRQQQWLPCPGCCNHQLMLFSQLKWVGGSRAKPEVVRESAWYECRVCGRKITSDHKPWMLEKGLWVPEGMDVVDGRLTGEPDHPNESHESFQLGALCSPSQPFGYVGQKFLEFGPTREFFGGVLGEPDRRKGSRVEEVDITALCVPAGEGMSGYRLVPPGGVGASQGRVIPAWVLVLVCFVDVSRDRMYVEVRGFGEKMERSALIWRQKIATPATDPMSPMDAVAAWSFMHADGLPMPLSAGAIDAGDPERRKQVYRWVKKQPWGRRGPKWFASKGQSGSNYTREFEVSYEFSPDDAYAVEESGKQVPAKFPFFRYNVDSFKGEVFSHMKASIQAAKSPAEGGRVTFLMPEMEEPDQFDLTEYIHQVTAEELADDEIKTGARAGYTSKRWKIRPGHDKDNHHWDTCVGCYALAEARGAKTLTESQVRAVRDRAKVQVEAGVDVKTTRPGRTAIVGPKFGAQHES